MMAKPTSQWLYRRADRVHGPVSLRDLEAAVLLGFVRSDDLVSRHERHCWKPLADHAELQGICAATQAGTQSGGTRGPTTGTD